MFQFLIIFFAVLLGDLAIIYGLYFAGKLTKKRHQKENASFSKAISDLDKDIDVWGCRTIIDTYYTGIQPWVGPSPASWPIGIPQKWEVKLSEDDTHYYARLIYHEYMLWWSWDEPYILVKLDKTKVPDLHDESNRGKVLWDITYNRLHCYDNYHYGLDKPVLQNINGHTVFFDGVDYKYYKYVLISNEDDRW